jgi:hypothetical protein
MRHGLALITDSLDQQQAAVERQTSVTVRHEDLRMLWQTAISTTPEVFNSDQLEPVTNVPAGYS